MPARTGRAARVAAQAKINLFLRVGPRQPSGYHEIQTMFQLLDLADDVTLRVGGSRRSITVSGPRLPAGGLGPPEENLAWRAAVAYADRAGWPSGFAIQVTKHIPVGGGLGGGSSDAGAVLRALNAMAERPMGAEIVANIAASLGADVPFFVSDSVRAVAAGRGERLSALAPLAARAVVLAAPSFGVATADAYRWLDHDGGGTLSVVGPPEGVSETGARAADSWAGIERLAANDFEPVIERRHPELQRIRDVLSASGARIARLSGSGSTVFAVFEGPPPAAGDLGVNAVVLSTRTATRVVPVEVLE